jgi:hypothetical protein
MKSSYTYTIDGNIIFIEDRSGNEFTTVTNAIESILHEISQDLIEDGISATGINNFKVIYSDSYGCIDGVSIDSDGKFKNFYHIGETNYHAAKLKVRY